MAAIEVTANKGSRSLTVSYDFGDNLQDAVAKFGEEVVFSNMRQSMKISLQALLRRGIDKSQEDAAVIAQAAAWKPGVATERTSDPAAAVLAKWGALTPEKKAELLKQLKAMQG